MGLLFACKLPVGKGSENGELTKRNCKECGRVARCNSGRAKSEMGSGKKLKSCMKKCLDEYLVNRKIC
jgi:hypothetical protein